VTVQAVPLTTALNVDGQLSEEIYSSVRPRSEFIQQEPAEDVAATERTDVWVFFDKDTCSSRSAAGRRDRSCLWPMR
jgi:hypothetical protein